MARYAYKCNKCRKRNMFNRPLNQYKRQRKCWYCGSISFHVDRERNRRTFIERNDVCYCQSVYPYPHRKGSKFCVHNKDYEYNIRTAGNLESDIDVYVDLALQGKVGDVSDECPF